VVYGVFNVYMNPQRNRILVEDEESLDLENGKITEDNIMSFIIWHSGSWYKKVN
jgi:hypothetical protein